MLNYLSLETRSISKTQEDAVFLSHVSRRSFLFGSAVVSGFALGVFTAPVHALSLYPTGGVDMPNGLISNPLVFVSISSDGTVSIVAHRSEMGQGVRTSLPMILADEMEADWSRVKVIQAPGDEPKYGNQNTDGSRSARHHLQTMRQMGATVRHMLVHAAAKIWGVNAREITVNLHKVLHKSSGRQLEFGDLVEKAKTQPLPELSALTFKSQKDFLYVGKGKVPIADLNDIITGSAVYGADIKIAGTKVAVIARPPVAGGKAISWDAQATMKVPGVEDVVELASSTFPAKFAPLGGIAVIANNTYAAIMGRKVLKIEWEDGPHGRYDSISYKQVMEATAKQPGKIVRDQGNVEAAFTLAEKTLQHEYYQAHMAQAPMEPPTALANFVGDKVEVWGPFQSPYDARLDVAATLHLDVDNVTVNVTLLGGGFGRKSKCDYALEAALISKKVGVPIRVQWTREDDIRHSFNHTTAIERIEAAVSNKGKVTGWLHRSVAPSLMTSFIADSGYQSTIENGMGLVDLPFDIDNIRCENGKAMAHTRIGWFRSVSNIHRAFAIQSFVAELAHKMGRDHKSLLLELIGPPKMLDLGKPQGVEGWWNYGEPKGSYLIDTGRLAQVLNLVAEKSGWGKKLRTGEGIGLAVHRSFLSYVAVAVRVKIVKGRVRVPTIHIGLDCGFVVNPERVRSQMEGSAVMGMTLALYSGLTYKNGQVIESNFHDYNMVRSENFPERVHTHIIDHPYSVPASGVGETGIPPIAPAIANAIFNASGKRIRQLPMGEFIDI